MRDQARRWRSEKGSNLLTVSAGGAAPHQNLSLQGARRMAGACCWAKNDSSMGLGSARSSEAVFAVLGATSIEASFRPSSGDRPRTARPVTGSISKGASAGGSAGIEAGCTRTPARGGGAVPSLPGRIGLMTGGRRAPCVGASGAHSAPLGWGSNGVTRCTRRPGDQGRSAWGRP